MHININNASQFRDQFHRADRGEQFSYEALGLLFDYFEEGSPEMELDVIAICCEYREASPIEIARDYALDWEDTDEDGSAEAVLSYVNDNTMVVGVTAAGYIVFAEF